MKSALPLPELLAPAGTLSAALAAYAAGADAVYCGVGRFNAREMGTNFSQDDLSRLSARAKADGRRFYVTLNTLVKENEWEAFGETVEEIAALDPDAVILQDLGVARFLRRFFPELELHASTQMGIHNSAGIRAAQEMGLSRVILERQVTLDELSAIIPASPLEVEVFIHGALCCSLSGNCLFSSWMGGWSGNRGRCKQPCRRRFHGMDDGTSGSGFYFSTQDLYSLDLIDDLQRLGVSSLKIEGRLKQPDYVYRVVQAYRTVLDAPLGERGGVIGEARRILSGSYGRRWSHGFATRSDMENLIQHDSLGVSGQLVGSVTEVRRGGFQMKVSRKIRLGDRLRIQPESGDEGPAFTVTAMRDGTSGIPVAGDGSSVFIPCDREVPRGGKVYRTGTSVKGMTFDGSGLPLYTRVRRFDLRVTVDLKGMEVEVADLRWSREEAFDTAEKHGLSADRVEQEFRRTRLDSIGVGECSVSVTGSPFVPASRLKQLRREFWEWFAQRVPPEAEDSLRDMRHPTDGAAFVLTAPEPAAVMLDPDGDRTPALADGAVAVVPLAFGEADPGEFDPGREYMLPHFCAEKELTGLKKTLDRALAAGCRRFRITSLYQLPLIQDAAESCAEELILTAAYPLPVANAVSAGFLGEQGVEKVQGWLELEKTALEALRDASPLPVEIYRYGRPPLLVTRAGIPASGRISDSRGGIFRVSSPDSHGLTYLYPEKPMAIPEIPGTLSCFDYRVSRPGEEETTDFNFNRELV